MDDKRELYFDLFRAYKATYPNKRAQLVQLETNTFWNSVKGNENYADAVKQKLVELGTAKRKADGTLMTFWSQVICFLLTEYY